MGERERLAWETLENIDIISARLARTYNNLIRLLGRAGAAVCDELNLYNQTALDLERVQRSALNALRMAGVKGLPTDPPFPPLFTGMGVNASPILGRISCSEGSVVQVFDGTSGVRALLQAPCPVPGQLSAAPLVVVGVTFVVSVAGYFTITKIAEVWRDVAIEAQNTRRGRLMAEYLDRRVSALHDVTERCVAAGGDPLDCLRQADGALPKTIDALRKSDISRGRGVLWWIGGIAVVAGATAGIIAWRRRRA